MTTAETQAAGDGESVESQVAQCRCVVEGLGYSYGNRTALSEVSFVAEAGESVAIVGPSGAGKTTLLRILTGMLEPGAGEVVLCGQQPHLLKSPSDRARLVGMVQQRLDLVGQLSVRHNVDAGMLGRWNLIRSLAGLVFPLQHSPSEDAINLVGLEGRGAERVSRLSGGEQQRVALARLIVQDPRVISADEPVSSLDPALADDVLKLLRKITVDGGRILVASMHNPQLAKAHFDRVIGLKHGSLQFDAPSDEVTDEMLAELYERSADDPVGDGAEPERDRLLWGI